MESRRPGCAFGPVDAEDGLGDDLGDAVRDAGEIVECACCLGPGEHAAFDLDEAGGTQ